jgi:PGF-pre-PGF domain-containing protein
MRKVAAVFSVLLILSLGLAGAFVAMTGTAQASHPGDTIIVNESAGSGTNDTIQGGVNHADPGETVFVEAGTYDESVVVNTTNITIITDESVTLDGSSPGVTGPAFNVTNAEGNVSNVLISGFTVTDYETGFSVFGTDVPGVTGFDMRNITVLNNTIRNVSRDAVSVRHRDGDFGIVNVANNTVTNASDGVSVSVNGSASTEDVTVANNTLADRVSGSAVSLSVDGSLGAPTPPGGPSASLSDVSLSLNNGSTAATGLDVTLNGSASITDLDVVTNDFSDTGENGIAVETGSLAAASIDGFDVNASFLNGSSGAAFTIDSPTQTLDISDLNVNTSDLGDSGAGLAVDVGAASTLSEINVSTSPVNATSGTAIDFTTRGVAEADNLTITGINGTANAGAVSVRALGGSSVTDVEISDSLFEESDGDAIALGAFGGSVTDVTVERAGLNRSTGAALSVTASQGGTMSSVAVSDVNATEGANGLSITSAGPDSSVDGIDVSDSLFNATDGTGVSIVTAGTSNVTDVSLATVDVRNNTNGLVVVAENDSVVSGLSTDKVGFESDSDAAVIRAGSSPDANATVEDLSFSSTGFNESGGTGLGISAAGDSEVTNVSLETVDARNNTNGLQVSASDNATISDLSTDEAGFESDDDAAVFEAVGDAVIEDLSFTDTGFNESGDTGLTLSAADGEIRNVSLDTVLAANNAAGLNATAVGSGVIENLTAETVGFNESTGTGIALSAIDGEIRDLTLNTVTAANNDVGIDASATGTGLISGITTDGALFESDGDAAVFEASGPDATVEDLSVTDTGFNESGDTGLTLSAADGEIKNVSLDTVLAANNGAGLNATAVGSGVIENLTFETVGFNESTGTGIALSADDGEISDLTLNTVTAGNNSVGIDASATGTGLISGISTDGALFGESDGNAGVFEASGGGVIEDLSFVSTGFNESGDTGLTLAAADGEIRNVSLDTVLVANNDAGLNATAVGSGVIENLTAETVGFNESTSGAGITLSAVDGEIRDLTLDTVTAANNDVGINASATGSGAISGLSTDTVLFGESDGDAGVFEAVGDAVIEDLAFDTTGFNQSGGTGIEIRAEENGSVTDVSFDTALANENNDLAAGIFAGSPGSGSTAAVENVSFATAGLNDTADGAGLRVEAWGEASVTDVSLDTVTLSNNTVGTAIFANENATVTGFSSDTALFGANDDRGVRLRAGRPGTDSNATIADAAFNTVGLNDTGSGSGLRIDAWGTSEVTDVSLDTIDASNNTRGLLVSAGEGSRIANLTADTVLFGDSDGDAAVLRAEDNATVETVRFETSGLNKSDGTGLRVAASGEGTIADVSLDTVLARNNTVGMNLSAVDNATITDVSARTVLFGNNTEGVRIGSEGDALIDRVRIIRSGLNQSTSGVVFDGDGTYAKIRIKESLIRANDVGVVVTPETDARSFRIFRSLIADNDFGIDNRNGSTVLDARTNWWGTSSGPSSAPGGDTPYADPVNGKLAIGNGDSVSEGNTPGVSNVRFDPAIGGKNRDQEDGQVFDPLTLGDVIVENVDQVPDQFETGIAGVTIEGPVSDFIGLNVWERSVLPLRGDDADAPTSIRNPEVIFRTDDGDVSINRDFINVFQQDRTLNVTFDQTAGADTTRFAGREVQFHAFRADDASDLTGAFSASLNQTNGNVTFGTDAVEVVELRDLGEVDENGTVTVEFTPDRPGEYLFALTTVESGDGFELDDTGDLSANLINDSTVFAGFELITVQQTNSTVTPSKEEVLPGESIDFTAQSNLAGGNVNHAVLLYDKSAYEDRVVVLDNATVTLTGNETRVDETVAVGSGFGTEVNTTVPGENAVFNLTGFVDGEPFLVSINVTQNCDPADSSYSASDVENNPCVNDVTTSGSIEGVPFSVGAVVSGDSTETLSIAAPTGISFDGENKTLQYVHAAVSGANTRNRSTEVGTLTAQEPESELLVSPPSLEFGTQPVNSSTTRTVTVTNNGTAPVSLTAINVSGQDSGQFTLMNGSPTVLAAGENTTIDVAFEPTSTGAKTAQLAIETNESAPSTTLVALNGTATAPEIVVSPPSLEFGTQPVNSSTTRTVTVTNNGTAPVNLTAINVSGQNPAEFTLVNGSPTALAAGENTTIDVAFEPTSPGPKTAQLAIETNGSAPSTTLVALNGTATAPRPPTEINTTLNTSTEFRFLIRNLRADTDVELLTPGLGDLDFQVESLTIRTAESLSTDPTVEVRITQTQTVPASTPELTGVGDLARYLNVTATGIQDDDIDNVRFQFWLSESRLGDSAPEDVVLYRFNNGSWGTVNTTFVGNTSEGNRRFVARSPGLSAFAAVINESEFSITDTDLDPETVSIGETANVTATIENTGLAEGEYTAQITANGDTVATRDVTIPANESRTIEVPVSFDQPGEYDIAINGTEVGTLTVVAPSINVDPGQVDFGEVDTNTTVTESVTVTNDGSDTLDISSVEISGADANVFTIVSNGTDTLEPGENTTIEVEFAPTTAGNFSAQLDIESNDPEAGTVSVPLSGTAESPTEPSTPIPEPPVLIIAIVIILILAGIVAALYFSGDPEVTGFGR